MSLESRPLPFHHFLWRVFVAVLLTLALIGVAVFLWYAAQALLLGLAGILLAIALTSLAELVRRVLPITRVWSLVIVFLILIALASGLFWFLAPSAMNEVQELGTQLPKAVNEVRAWAYEQPLIRQFQSYFPIQSAQTGTSQWSFAGQVTGFFSATYVVILEFLMVIFMGIALAAEPQTYVNGGLLLLPPKRRPRVREILDALHVTLQRWIAGQFLSMVSVGILTFIGLLILQMPLAFSLSLISGLLDFIPTIGPILGAIPALLIAALRGPFTVFLVAVVYIIVHLVEGYLLMPFIHRYTVSLPPVVTVIVLLVLGFLLGPLGLLLATPITAVAIVLIKMLYMEGMLKEDISLPGQ